MLQGLKFFFGLIIVFAVTACQPSSDSSSSSSPATPSSDQVKAPTEDSTPGSQNNVPGAGTNTDIASETRLDHRCVKSLCGKGNPLPHPFETTPDAEPAARAAIEAKVNKPLKNYMGRIIHLALLQDAMFKKVFEQKSQITISSEKYGLVKAIQSANNLSKFLPALETDKQGEKQFNLPKLRTLIGSGKEEEAQAVATLISLMKFIQGYGPVFESFSLEMALKIFYPNESVLSAQQLEASQIEMVNSFYETILPEMKMARPEDFVLVKAKAGEILSFTEKNILKRLMRNRYIMLHLLDPTLQAAFKKIPIDVSATLTEAKKVYLGSRQAKSVAGPKAFKQLLNDAVQTCSTKLSYSYGALPTLPKLDQFQKTFNHVQEIAQAMIEERIKASLQEPLNVQLILPAPREKAIDSWALALQEAVTASDVRVRELKKLDLSDNKNLESMFVSAALFTDHEVFEDIFEFCDQAKVPFLDDAAFRSMNMINFSWPTIVHSEMGTGIAAHELGHIVSGIWPDLVQKEKSCLVQKQGVGQYAEEDFADLFASEVSKRMGFQTEESSIGNFACSLLGRNKNEWVPGTLKNAVPSDTHSAALFRLVAIAEMTGRQSDSCRVYLRTNLETRFKNYCQWEK